MNYLLTLTAAPTATTTDRALLLGQLAAGVREAAALGTLHAVSEPASVRVEDASELYVLSLYDGYDLSETLLGVVTGDGLRGAVRDMVDHIVHDHFSPEALDELYGPMLAAGAAGDAGAFNALMLEHSGGDNTNHVELHVTPAVPGRLTPKRSERVQWLLDRDWVAVPGSRERLFTHPELSAEPVTRDVAFDRPEMQARLRQEQEDALAAFRAPQPYA
jgi:hypothetical protein